MKEIVKENKIESDKFAMDVDAGLSMKEKKISSKYLYNKEGSRLFEEIMELPEYYPSNCEMEILQKYKNDILKNVYTSDELYVVDLGAGNGLKTMVLLKFFQERTKLKYIPIDISLAAIETLEQSVKSSMKDLIIESVHSEYMEGLLSLKDRKNTRKLVLFLGSTIGNFTFQEASNFFTSLNQVLNQNDVVLIGFDLKKNPNVIRNAYNDTKGITASFNLNLLSRINDELGGDFILQNFLYYPSYNPVTGELISRLVSKEEQQVTIKALDRKYHFAQWETLQTECSNKFDLSMVKKLADSSGYDLIENYYDSKLYFIDSVWRVK